MNTLASRHNVKSRGDGDKTIVFSHGFGCDQIVWRDVASAFGSEEKVVLFDYAGSGKADKSLYDRQRHSTLLGYAQDVISLLDELGLQNVEFVAHSASAMIAALAARLRPDLFARLIMIGPSACYLNERDYEGGFERRMLEELIELLESNYMDWTQVFAPIVIGNPDRPSLSQGFVETLCRNDPDILAAFARVTFFSDTRDELGDVRVPCVVLQCQDDPVAPEPAIQFVHRALPESQLIRLAASGHCPHITHPEEIIDLLRGLVGTGSSEAA